MIAIALLALRWLTQPDRVAGMLLSRTGAALGLEITASGASEYRLLGTPMIAVRDVVAKQPGEAAPLLRAKRVYLTLPWSTIRARGADLTVERIELDEPQLDVAALQRWLASRPPGETKIPTLTDGLRIAGGRAFGKGWSLSGLELSLPSLYPNRPMRASAKGMFALGDTRLPFDLRIALTRPAANAGFGAAGSLAVESGDWKLPMSPVLGGRLHSGADGIGLDRMKLGANARYVSASTELPFVLGLAGPVRYREGEIAIAPLGAIVHGEGVIPNLNSHGRLMFGDGMNLRLSGKLAEWPQAWPALPAPIGASKSPLPFSLEYAGKTDFSDAAALDLQRDATKFAARFRLPDVLAWIDAGSKGSPLPPMDGVMSTPEMEVSGAHLEGVEIEMEDPAIAEPVPR
ncbi:MAG TPA: hypothetical protein VJ806_05985 [Luteimonas sp.]|nr:hypothetical protein [Luteimonas sp.]